MSEISSHPHDASASPSRARPTEYNQWSTQIIFMQRRKGAGADSPRRTTPDPFFILFFSLIRNPVDLVRFWSTRPVHFRRGRIRKRTPSVGSCIRAEFHRLMSEGTDRRRT